eukprot:TRINITY_DN5990_c0_g1_i1.p1 TRINITY_DN5990_c0_g1~~TRINITY_DN5990_c0_g1_i1.p1  ORF type:complete len:964 (+),score=231.79 TRINITY_DN5990_c0_g1_i1:51-2894(+)
MKNCVYTLLALACTVWGGPIEDAVRPGVQWGVIKGLYSDPNNLNVPSLKGSAACIFKETMYVHGGEDLISGDQNDSFHALSLETMRWATIQLNTAVKPGVRSEHHLICDEQRNTIYLLGGKADQSWIFNVTNSTWTKMASKGDDPLAPGDDEISADFVPIETTDYIVVVGSSIRLNVNWYIYDKNTDVWDRRVEPLLSVEDPGGAGVGSTAYVIGGTTTYGDTAQPNTLSIDTAEPGDRWEIISTDIAGEEHHAAYLGDNIILLIGDVGGKGEQSHNNGIALLNISSPQKWVRVNRTDSPGEMWIPNVSEMEVMAYRGLLIIVGGTMDNNGTYMNEDLYVFSRFECPGNCSERGECVLGNCICASSSGISCETLDPTSEDLLPLILGPVGGVVLFILIGSAIMWKATEQTRMLRKMYNTTRITGDLAEQVARMELDELDYLLEIEHPTMVQASFIKILHILKTYRPYIPEALYTSLSTSESRELNTEMAQPPGRENDAAAIVFTDIKSSTATWEACPDGMKKGLRIHNDVIRKCLGRFGGYEVKTIGDAFMVAFETPVDAFRFALQVQEELYKATWPAALLALPWCSKEDGMNGIRVRIGVQFGDVDVQINDLTGRCDYFGTTVNKAARLESVCLAGAIATTQDMIDILVDQNMLSTRQASAVYSTPYSSTLPTPSSRMLDCLANPAVLNMGERVLNGITEKADVVLLVPQLLIKRTEAMMGDLRKAKGGSSVGSQMSDMSVSVRINKEIRGEQLVVKDSVTVGHVDVVFSARLVKHSEPHVPVSEVMTMLFTHMERTQGTVLTVAGSSVHLAWNTTKKCPAHVENSLQFLMLVQRQSMSSAIKGTQVGLCSGQALTGNIGTTSKRFVNVMGECVDVADRLARATVEHKVKGLYVDLIGTAKKYSTYQLNRIDELDDIGDKPIPVYEVCLPEDDGSLASGSPLLTLM